MFVLYAELTQFAQTALISPATKAILKILNLSVHCALLKRINQVHMYVTLHMNLIILLRLQEP